jgi:hypothetical protein
MGAVLADSQICCWCAIVTGKPELIGYDFYMALKA